MCIRDRSTTSIKDILGIAPRPFHPLKKKEILLDDESLFLEPQYTSRSKQSAVFESKSKRNSPYRSCVCNVDTSVGALLAFKKLKKGANLVSFEGVIGRGNNTDRINYFFLQKCEPPAPTKALPPTEKVLRRERENFSLMRYLRQSGKICGKEQSRILKIANGISVSLEKVKDSLSSPAQNHIVQ
eukprot:TRINITY_DN18574_c0_g1_i1.p1 TRINITY_DN18574_c0_g1~~TRINITY_DN18574_c0_g1_i1.p1  ORF type:complete len:185 (+),score=11.72 TRINITY_DN18574_c0_g1_i1:118-672(+)